MSQTFDHFYFHDNVGKGALIFISISLVNSDRIRWKNLELKQLVLSTLLSHYPANCKRSTTQRYIPASENDTLRVRRHLLHEVLFDDLFFMTLMSLRHYCDILSVALIMPFMKINVCHSHSTIILTNPLISGVHDSKHALNCRSYRKNKNVYFFEAQCTHVAMRRCTIR